MKFRELHIAKKITAFLVVASLLLPYSVKLIHALEHHDHEICLVKDQSHFHEIDLDCDFFKSKINHNLFFGFFNYEYHGNSDLDVIKIAYYNYLKSHQQLHSTLRGPPNLS